MNRVLQAARLHLIHPLVILGIPWLVVSISFAINAAVWHLTPAGEDDGGFTGGILALYFTVLVVYVQAVTQLLPFAMGTSLSRRTFYLGTALVAVVQSLVYGVAITALVAIENATDGWGAGMQYWAPGVFEVDNAVLQVLASGAPMLAFMSVGIGVGIVHKRWGQTGTWGLIIGSMIFFGGLALLITWLEAWQSVGDWFADQSVATLTIGLPLVVAVAVALASFPGIRRVVP
ncbi:hypothetical protein SAMN05660748_1178 [Blastococcus aggregatus]|uniref:ABC-2 type transport system permease protein n=1 Tax=Blastococcus aggregatus TaxID=38502 RepID=A0A285V1S9_9ACTN|nr:hypothetical protein [Blastococcus aggregatus]SOC48010.1 hypothetical protein SAMN05660748_1178 [Blastococcus aggregatus]